MYARIIDQDGVQTVAEVVDFDPTERFTPEIATLFTPATPDMVYMARLINGVWIAPPEPDPVIVPDPEPFVTVAKKKALSFVEFVMLVKVAGGLTDAQAVEILETSPDPSLVLNRIMLEKATVLEHGNSIVLAGLNLLETKGYISSAGHAAILAAWPNE